MSLTYPSSDQLIHVEHANGPSTIPYPGVSLDKGACRLLGPTALIVQALMGGLVISSLIIKRQREKPMRPWRIWLFDVSKQILGQIFVHTLNLFISDLVAHLAHGNPCNLYFLNILVDTTLGVGYIYLVLHGADKLFTDYLHLKGFRSGQYGDPPSVTFWARQAAVYVFTILTMKLLVVGLFAAWPGIFDVGEWLLGWTRGNDRVQVIFVMGVFPIIMNVLQFWLIDSIVKASASVAITSTQASTDNVRQPLFHNTEDDDEDDDTEIRSQRRYDIESPPTPQHKPLPHNGKPSKTKPFVPGSVPSHVDQSATNHFSYPPNYPSPTTANKYHSPASSASTSTSSVMSFGSKKAKRRSPPPPIIRPPHMSTDTKYIISMTPSPSTISMSSQYSLARPSPPSPLKAKPRQRHRSQGDSRSKLLVKPETQAFDWREADDWAEKVGEEDWTGRRVGEVKAALDGWGNKASASVQVS